MRYVKCILAGLIALISIILLSHLLAAPLVAFFSHGRGGATAAQEFNLVDWVHSSLLPWFIMLSVFAAGFYWQFRRSRS